jgi:hypothetical protein
MEDAGEVKVGVCNHTITVHQEPGKPTMESIKHDAAIVFKPARMTENKATRLSFIVGLTSVVSDISVVVSDICCL